MVGMIGCREQGAGERRAACEKAPRAQELWLFRGSARAQSVRGAGRTLECSAKLGPFFETAATTAAKSSQAFAMVSAKAQL